MMAWAKLLFSVLFCNCYFVSSEIVHFLSFSSCISSGWSCVNKTGGLMDLIYQCDKETSRDFMIGKTKLNLPERVTSLTIQECNSIHVSFSSNFTSDKSNLTLAIKNVINVLFLPSMEIVILPKQLLLQNIQLIESLRSYTFTGSWESITFYNVTFERFESDSFAHTNIEKSMKWEYVNIGLLDTNALNEIEAKEFIVSHCFIGTFELLSFQVGANKVVIENSHINDIRFQAVYILADTFLLRNNSGFRVVMPNALNILAREVIINENNFTYLQTEALEKIGPTLLEEDPEPQILFSFQKNHIQVADVGSLHVSLTDYLQSGATMLLGNNTFSCSCTHLGWLGLKVPPQEVYDFHQRLISPEENNTCADVPCYLPINILQELVKSSNTCAANFSGSELCSMFPQPTFKSYYSDGCCVYVSVFTLLFVIVAGYVII